MNWYFLLVTLTISIVANLLTPSVHSALKILGKRTGTGLLKLSEKGLRLRLQQLDEELSDVTNLKNNPSKLSAHTIASVLPLLVLTWVVLGMLYAANLYDKNSSVSISLYGAVGGLVGLGMRWLLSALATWNLIDKVCGYDKFISKNRTTYNRVETLLNQQFPKPE